MDPVRYISNHSTGRMGIAIADCAADAGADVVLVMGPVTISTQNSSVRVVNVTDAASMAKECIELFHDCDIAILAAAVADFTPVNISGRKMKREGNELVIKFKPTTDIAATLGKMKRPDQLVAGFALETDNELENAVAKLKNKNLDLIILNSLRDTGAGFGYDSNKITIIDRYNNIGKFELKSKKEAAADIIDKIAGMIIMTK
ncbi:MAG TPA: phosphopantothenoylcysteine decarboxylase [Bacteroidales bacterium]|nr:phosphopantothenoylcysteine decarboxylase [Bacteroidales bacterium]